MSVDRRLFFALPLPEKLQRQIIKWRAESFQPQAGRPIAGANLHLTLAFLGEIGERKTQALADVASRITAPAFSLLLDDIGHWPTSGVIWLGTKKAPRRLLQLASLLRSHASRNGCQQSTLPFHPHISLLRGATRQVAIPPVTPKWPLDVNSFGLYQSIYERGRTSYSCLQSWSMPIKTPTDDI